MSKEGVVDPALKFSELGSHLKKALAPSQEHQYTLFENGAQVIILDHVSGDSQNENGRAGLTFKGQYFQPMGLARILFSFGRNLLAHNYIFYNGDG